MRLGHLAPAPGSRSGVADYAETLVAALRQEGPVDDAAREITIYHVGNNGLHREIYREALRRPGIVILHDAVLHHLMLGTLSREEYIAEFVYNYGEWNRHTAEQLWDARAGSAADAAYFAYPMLRRIAEHSRVVVVHNPVAASMVRAAAPGARIEVVPHLFSEAPNAARVTLDLPGRCVFGVFGYLRPSKRLESVLAALDHVPGASLLVSGEFVSDSYARAIAPLLDRPNVRWLRHADEGEFLARAAAVDVCVNLRAPSAGESSGIATRLMGVGKPVIVTDGEEHAGIPEHACVRIDAGATERPMLATMMQWLADSPGARNRIGEAARAHIAEHHATHRIAKRIWDIARTLMTLALCLLAAMQADAQTKSSPNRDAKAAAKPPKAFVKKDTKVSMRDGVRLATTIYLPSNKGRFPVILLRTPYDRGRENPPPNAYLIEKGFALVTQDVRGRYGSEGEFDFVNQEPNDGYDTLNWIVKQNWSDGKVGMIGGSYSGLLQWKTALLQHPALKAIFPVHSGIDEYRDRFYDRGGALRLGHRMLWLADNLRRKGFADPGFENYVRHTPLRTLDLAATGRPLALFQLAIAHPAYDSYWRAISAREQLSKMRVPAFSVAGWYDPNVVSDLEAISTLRRGSENYRIAVGAWAHSMSAPFEGVSFGPEAMFPIRSAQIAWFERWLKGRAEPTPPAPIRIFVMGLNKWRDEQEWPLKRAVETKLYLAGEGRLADAPEGTGVDEYTYDPRNPVPTRGGATCCNPKIFPWGPIDQRPLETRPDVKIYMTPPLKSDVEVTGPIRAYLRAATSAPDTDFTLKLMDVFPSGESRLLTDGILRLRYRNGMDHEAPNVRPDEIYPIMVFGGVTSNLFRAGHRIGVAISSSNFPKYDRNPNTGRPVASETEFRPARQRLYRGERHPSYIALPVVSSKEIAAR